MDYVMNYIENHHLLLINKFIIALNVVFPHIYGPAFSRNFGFFDKSSLNRPFYVNIEKPRIKKGKNFKRFLLFYTPLTPFSNKQHQRFQDCSQVPLHSVHDYCLILPFHSGLLFDLSQIPPNEVKDNMQEQCNKRIFAFIKFTNNYYNYVELVIEIVDMSILLYGLKLDSFSDRNM